MLKLLFQNDQGKFELTKEEIEELKKQAWTEGFQAGGKLTETYSTTTTSTVYPPYTSSYTVLSNAYNSYYAEEPVDYSADYEAYLDSLGRRE